MMPPKAAQYPTEEKCKDGQMRKSASRENSISREEKIHEDLT